MKRFSVFFAAALLCGGCITIGTKDNGDVVVSPTTISNQQQEDGSLYLEDTEHWWEEAQ